MSSSSSRTWTASTPATPRTTARRASIPLVTELTDEVARYADGAGARGRGGMASKLDAARIATRAGGIAVIANGRTPGILDRLFGGESVGTLFVPQAARR